MKIVKPWTSDEAVTWLRNAAAVNRVWTKKILTDTDLVQIHGNAIILEQIATLIERSKNDASR